MELRELIKQGEGDQLDFKNRVDNQKQIAKTLSAFANTKGGNILVGVKENGKVSGCEPSDVFHMISAAADLYTEPIVAFETKIHQDKHKLVLEVIVPKSSEIVQCLDEDNNWIVYYRIKEVTLEANPVLRKLLAFRFSDVSYSVNDKLISDLLEVLSSQGKVSFSKLTKLLDVKLDTIEDTLAHLLLIGTVRYDLESIGIVYSLKDK